jgi:hypothetical protein
VTFKLYPVQSVKNPERNSVVIVDDQIKFIYQEKAELDRARMLLELGRVTFICNAIESDWITVKGVVKPMRREGNATASSALMKLRLLLKKPFIRDVGQDGGYRDITYADIERFYLERNPVPLAGLDTDRAGRITWLTYLIDNC